MSEMIERVARAISQSFHEEGYIEGVSDPSEWEEFLKAARAAIEAMRDPTDAMQQAVWEACFDNKYDGTQAPAAYAMCVAVIDAALEDKP